MSVSPPFFGVNRIFIERIDSLENDWYVEFWREHYFFLGIEMFSRKRRMVVCNSSKRRGSNGR